MPLGNDGNDGAITRRQILAAAAVGGLSLQRGIPGLHSEQDDPATRGGQLVEYINFNNEDSLNVFDDIDYREHIELIEEGPRSGQSILVRIPEGNHNGGSLFYRFDSDRTNQPEGLWATYHLYFPDDFVIEDDTGKLPGPAGRYDSAGWGNRPSNGTNGWSARMGFYHPDEGDNNIGLSYYVYHADMEQSYGEILTWDQPITAGQWHRIDQYIELNTPEMNDGILRGWVDGNQQFEQTDLRFRDTDELRIEEYWFNIYWGGSDPSPDSNAMVFDDLSLIRYS